MGSSDTRPVVPHTPYFPYNEQLNTRYPCRQIFKTKDDPAFQGSQPSALTALATMGSDLASSRLGVGLVGGKCCCVVVCCC